ncbi:MAG: hypothetical protein ABGZ17_01775 [Planctomycetaceae bacterium]
MTRRHTTWVFLLIAAGSASADERDAEMYLRSVRALGSPEFESREAASRHLSSGGAAALRVVLDHADLTDLEVFTRVVQLIHITAARHDSETMQAAMTRLKHMGASAVPMVRDRATQVLAMIHRRSLETVLASGGKLQTVKWPDGQTGIKVTLYHWHKSTLVALMSLSHLHLVLSGPRFEDGSLSNLHKLKNLRVLDVRYTRASDKTLRSIAQLADLEKLYLSRTHVTDAGMPQLKNLRQLTELFLTDTAITDDSLQQLEKLPRLRRVSLRGTQVTETALDGFRSRRPGCQVQF